MMARKQKYCPVLYQDVPSPLNECTLNPTLKEIEYKLVHYNSNVSTKIL